MYVLQFVDTFTQELIRQETYEEPDVVEKIIDSYNDVSGLDVFLVDSHMKILRAKYVTYKAYPEGNDMLYQLFFKVLFVEAEIKR